MVPYICFLIEAGRRVAQIYHDILHLGIVFQNHLMRFASNAALLVAAKRRTLWNLVIRIDPHTASFDGTSHAHIVGHIGDERRLHERARRKYCEGRTNISKSISRMSQIKKLLALIQKVFIHKRFDIYKISYYFIFTFIFYFTAELITFTTIVLYSLSPS